MSTKNTAVEAPAMDGFARVVLWVTFAFAIAAMAAILVLSSIPVIGTLLTGTPPLQLITGFFLQPGSFGTQGYDSAVLVMGNMSSLVVTLASAASLAQILTQAALAALVALLAWRLLHSSPFRRSLSTVTVAGGIVLLTGGMVAQALGVITNGVAVAEANRGIFPGVWPLAGKFDPTFIGIGAVLILAGIAFRYGTRLQRDTDGLV